MKLNVNPNRMELIKLRRRLVLARRGHKLLKDKRDELMRIFMEMFEKVYRRRVEVEKKFYRAFTLFKYARAQMTQDGFGAAAVWRDIYFEFETALKPLLNLRVPEYKIKISGNGIWWETSLAPLELLESFKAMVTDVLPEMLAIAAEEKSLKLLSAEIERTRRRVNALEYVLIPNLMDTIRYISMRLAENERSEQVRLMKVKEIVRGH